MGKKRAKAVAIVILCMVFLTPLFYIFYLVGPGYRSELRAIREQLTRIRGVQSFEVWGIEDYGLDHFAVRVTLSEGGVIDLREVTPQTFDGAPSIWVDAMCGYRIRMVPDSYGYDLTGADSAGGAKVYGMPTDIGESSPAGELLGIRVRKFQDVVDAYKSICEVLEHWPVFPEVGKIEYGNGHSYSYWTEEQHR